VLSLDEFVIMPDHVHFIVRLEGNVEKATTLGRIIGAYKSLTAVLWLRHIEAMGIAGIERSGRIWKRDYYEQVIRDVYELEQKRKYIRYNPIRWKQRHEPTK
jgi:putative transposase